MRGRQTPGHGAVPVREEIVTGRAELKSNWSKCDQNKTELTYLTHCGCRWLP